MWVVIMKRVVVADVLMIHVVIMYVLMSLCTSCDGRVTVREL